VNNAMSFDQFVVLLQKGGPYGFAIFFAAIVVVVGQATKLWPFTTISDAQMSYILWAGLVGCGLFVTSLATYFCRATLWCWRGARRLVRNLTVMGRVSNLMPVEQAALFWIACHPKANIHGSPLESPFRALHREGFLTLTDSALFKQTFRVNWQVYWRKKKLAKQFPKLKDLSGDVEAPWKPRRV
jgi:hypothetical protein